MFFPDVCKPQNLANLIEKFGPTRIWKKRVFSDSFKKIFKAMINFTVSRKNILKFKDIDIKLYILFVKFKDYYNSLILINLLQLQEDSQIIRIVSILYQKFNHGSETFYLNYCQWKNDLRFNKNLKYLFERKNKYLNKVVNLIFEPSQFDLLFNGYKNLKRQLRRNIYNSKYYFLSRNRGTAVFIPLDLFY